MEAAACCTEMTEVISAMVDFNHFSLQIESHYAQTLLTHYLMNTYSIFATILTMPYPIMPVGVVAGKAMIDGG